MVGEDAYDKLLENLGTDQGVILLDLFSSAVPPEEAFPSLSNSPIKQDPRFYWLLDRDVTAAHAHPSHVVVTSEMHGICNCPRITAIDQLLDLSLEDTISILGSRFPVEISFTPNHPNEDPSDILEHGHRVVASSGSWLRAW